jgi:ATP-binding cassette subfamily F protein 3
MDEPTNHLDIPAREAIEGFMATSPATLLVVSHDRRLLETVCEKLWVVDAGAAVAFDGGYRAWRAAVSDGWTVAGALEVEAARLRGGSRGAVGRAAKARIDAVPSGRSGRASAVAVAYSATGETAAGTASATRTRTRKEKLSKDAYRRQKATVEGELTRLHLRKNHLELAMGDPNVSGNYVEMRRVTSELADVEAALATAEDAWLELEERAP